MPRNARLPSAESIVHVIDRGVDRRDIFLNDGDRLYFLRLMKEAFREAGIKVIAWCLMGNHFHLLLAVAQVELAVPMHSLLQRYAAYFNHRQGRSGHLFQNRYKPFRVRSVKRLHHLVDYIHRNPVAAGFVSDPGDWPWSSHHEFVSGDFKRVEHSTLEELSGVTSAELREAYLELLRERRESPGARQSLESHLQKAADIAGIEPSEVVAPGRDEQQAWSRRLFILAASKDDYSQAEIARILGRTQGAVSQILRDY